MNSHPRAQPDNSLVIRSGGLVYRASKNLRMRNSVLLIAEMFTASVGITHLALGSGLGNGSLGLPQAPDENLSTLRQEFVRLPITSIAFNDPDNLQGDTYTDGVRTNRILVSTSVLAASAAEQITEAALFGGTGAADTNGGTIFSMVTFPVLDNRAGGENPSAPEDLSFDWVLKFPLIAVEDEA